MSCKTKKIKAGGHWLDLGAKNQFTLFTQYIPILFIRNAMYNNNNNNNRTSANAFPSGKRRIVFGYTVVLRAFPGPNVERYSYHAHGRAA